MILCLSRHLFQFNARVLSGNFKTPYGEIIPHRMSTQTAGFIGYGRIARQAAGKLKTAFGMKIVCCDPFLAKESVEAIGAEKLELAEVLQTSDYVSINVSLLPTTRNLLGSAEIALMKPTSFLINCSRGGIVNEDALADALLNKRIAGAAMDTFTHEPLPIDHIFCKLDNVILTPHVAWYTHEAVVSVQRVAAEQVALVLTGKKPTRCVNLDVIQKN